MKSKMVIAFLVGMISVFSTNAQTAANVKKYLLGDAQVKKITLSSGVELEYTEQGDKKGIPVIFLHGITDSRHSYDETLEFFPRTFHSYALSLRGHGNSSKPEEGYTPSDFAEDVAEFVRKMKTGPVIIVGHSMGAMVAQQFVVNHQHLVRGVVLLGAFSSLKGNVAVDEFAASLELQKDPMDTSFVSDFQLATLAETVRPEFLNKVVSESLKVPLRVWKAAIAGIQNLDLTPELKKLNTPSLILWGNKDLFCSLKDQEILNSSLKGSRLIVYEGTGHAIHWEQPARVALDLIDFINNDVVKAKR